MRKILSACALVLLLGVLPVWADNSDENDGISLHIDDWTDEDSEVDLGYDDSAAVGQFDASSFKVDVENGAIVVYSNVERQLPAYSSGGRLVKILSLREGRNEIDGLPQGILIVGNKKVRI